MSMGHVVAHLPVYLSPPHVSLPFTHSVSPIQRDCWGADAMDKWEETDVGRSVPPLWVVLVPYIIWIQFDKAPDWGGRPSERARRFFIWKYFARMFLIVEVFLGVLIEQNTILAVS